jgi:hypothetical protein
MTLDYNTTLCRLKLNGSTIILGENYTKRCAYMGEILLGL